MDAKPLKKMRPCCCVRWHFLEKLEIIIYREQKPQQ